jgi:hypothetical protein
LFDDTLDVERDFDERGRSARSFAIEETIARMREGCQNREMISLEC